MTPKAKQSPTNGKNERASHPRHLPFCLAEHEWLPRDWLKDYPPDFVIRDFGPGKMALVRRSGSHEVFGEPNESKESIQAWTEERTSQECDLFFKSDREHTAKLFIRASVSNAAVTCLGLKANHLLRMLIALARDGNATAARELTNVSKAGLAAMKQIAEHRPELLRPLARQSWKWPVFKSLHPLLSDDHEIILRNLCLGEDLPFELHESARWILDDSGRIAFDLLIYIWNARREDHPVRWNYGIVGEVARKLRPLTSETAGEWWEVAAAIFSFSYPKPETIPELSKLVTARSHRKSPGRIKRSILQKIKARFTAFARPPV